MGLRISSWRFVRSLCGKIDIWQSVEQPTVTFHYTGGEAFLAAMTGRSRVVREKLGVLLGREEDLRSGRHRAGYRASREMGARQTSLAPVQKMELRFCAVGAGDGDGPKAGRSRIAAPLDRTRTRSLSVETLRTSRVKGSAAAGVGRGRFQFEANFPRNVAGWRGRDTSSNPGRLSVFKDQNTVRRRRGSAKRSRVSSGRCRPGC